MNLQCHNCWSLPTIQYSAFYIALSINEFGKVIQTRKKDIYCNNCETYLGSDIVTDEEHLQWLIGVFYKEFSKV